MLFAEVIFETGAKSIVSYDSEDELKGFIKEHTRRVLEGIPGAPQEQYGRNDISPADFNNMPSLDTMKSRPAERISKVYLYSAHPVDLHPTGIDAKTVHELIEGMAQDGRVDQEQLVGALRDEVSPIYPVKQGRLESDYKAEADGQLDLSFLNDSGTSGVGGTSV